jgi:OOP family OmpA-OmpF porin
MAPEPVAIAPRVIAPEPVAATPPPAPAPAPAPVVRPLMKVAFSADSLFDFDKAIVKPLGKQHLDKFAADLRGTRYEVITIVGHTDRLGSPSYNMALSTRRAEAVKAYLADTASIPASKMTTRGASEAQPVTKAGECRGQKPSKSLIACLQADRRVDVEVTGTR